MSYSHLSATDEDDDDPHAVAHLSSAALQKQAQEYDRRQIRHKVRDKLAQRGIDLKDVLILHGEDDDDEAAAAEELEDSEHRHHHSDTSFLDDSVYPWKRREAEIEMLARGGRTEGRMEGYDSLERALQAHHHKLHYGRGRGFGWSSQAQQQQHTSAQQTTANAAEEGLRRTALASQRLTDWTSFRELNQGGDEKRKKKKKSKGEDGSATTGTSKETQAALAQDEKIAKQQHRQHLVASTLYILGSLGLLVGFAYYVEIMKIDTYQTYLPKGYSVLNDENLRLAIQLQAERSDESVEVSESQSGYTMAQQQIVAAPQPEQGRAVETGGGSGIFEKAKAARTAAASTSADNQHIGAYIIPPPQFQRRDQTQEEEGEEIDRTRYNAIQQMLTNDPYNIPILSSPAYQQALDWLVFNDALQLPVLPSNEVQLLQRFALAWLYFAFRGNDWQRRHTTSGHFLSEHTLQPVCQWQPLVERCGGYYFHWGTEIRRLNLSDPQIRGRLVLAELQRMLPKVDMIRTNPNLEIVEAEQEEQERHNKPNVRTTTKMKNIRII